MEKAQEHTPDKAKGKWEEALTGTKDTLSAIRELALLILFVLLLLFPGIINNRLVAAGFTKGDIAGLHWEKAQSASEKTGEASQQVEAVTQKIDSVKKQLDAVAEKTQNPEIRNAASELKQAIETAKNTRQDLKISLDTQEDILQRARPEAVQDSGPWGVVISADKNLPEAQYEADQARKLDSHPVRIYDRQNWLRTVVEFPTLADAQAAFPTLRTKLRDSAYLVNLAKWCPVHRENADGTSQCVGQ